MLNPFPDLLTYGFFAPTLLRLAVAAVLLYVAYQQWQRFDEITHTRFPVVGHGAWIAWLCIAFNTAAGAMLLVGYYTQIAALLVAISVIKSLIFKSRYPRVFPLSRSGTALVLVICLSLLVTGAGAYALDLPL